MTVKLPVLQVETWSHIINMNYSLKVIMNAACTNRKLRIAAESILSKKCISLRDFTTLENALTFLQTHRVTHISLYHFNLTASIPSIISNISHINQLFVETIDLEYANAYHENFNYAKFLWHRALIKKCPNIKNIFGEVPKLESLDAENLKNVERLRLGICSDKQIKILAKKCPNLQEFSLKDEYLANNANTTDQSLIALKENCPNIHSFNFSWCFNITLQGSFGFIQHYSPHLIEVGIPIANDEIFEILSNNPKLETITMQRAQGLTPEGILKVLTKCPNLKYLKLDGDYCINEECLRQMAYNNKELMIDIGTCYAAKEEEELYPEEILDDCAYITPTFQCSEELLSFVKVTVSKNDSGLESSQLLEYFNSVSTLNFNHQPL